MRFFDHKAYSCRDRMCGAEDCTTCHPENFEGSEYVGDRFCSACGDAGCLDKNEDGDWLCESCAKLSASVRDRLDGLEDWLGFGQFDSDVAGLCADLRRLARFGEADGISMRHEELKDKIDRRTHEESPQ